MCFVVIILGCGHGPLWSNPDPEQDNSQRGQRHGDARPRVFPEAEPDAALPGLLDRDQVTAKMAIVSVRLKLSGIQSMSRSVREPEP